MDDLVKRLNEDFSVNAREDIQHQMKVYEAERKEAADRIEQQEWYLAEAQKCLDAGDYEGAVIICRAALGEKKDG